MISKYSLQI